MDVRIGDSGPSRRRCIHPLKQGAPLQVCTLQFCVAFGVCLVGSTMHCTHWSRGVWILCGVVERIKWTVYLYKAIQSRIISPSMISHVLTRRDGFDGSKAPSQVWKMDIPGVSRCLAAAKPARANGDRERTGKKTGQLLTQAHTLTHTRLGRPQTCLPAPVVPKPS